MHCHTSKISRCCMLCSKEVLNIAKENNYDGIVVTNHYTNYDLQEYLPEDFVKIYLKECQDTIAYGQSIGLRVFSGVEVTMAYDQRVHLLIYGDVEFLLKKSFNLPNMTQKDLFDLCNQNQCVLINAHPFRYGCTVQDLRYLHGVEANCHLLHGDSRIDEVLQIAKENNFAITCGCDYHGDSERPKGGMFLPDNICTNNDLAKYLKTSKQFSLKIEDPVTRRIYNTEIFTR